MKITNDLVRVACERAAFAFGRGDGTFNSAGFSNALTALAGVSTVVDGKLVSAILCGRPDIERLSGGAHWRLVR